MRAKMDLLESAHRLLCNVDDMSAEEGEEWRKAFREWHDRYNALLIQQRPKRHNRRMRVISKYLQEQEDAQAEKAREARMAKDKQEARRDTTQNPEVWAP